MTPKHTSYFKKLLDLREGADDKKTIIENVKDDSDFSSVRFWILVCAVLVASVGLNMNSVPVIIGAMLISPLMGPIVSMGVALSIYDWGLMRRSLRNLLILTAIGTLMSTLYFALSPINNAQSELLARIQPTIFDVLIAVFGGAAGFIGISRARTNNVVPGVAIATALMPPLCTIGYGIGTLQPQFIFGAAYLYLINSIFICLSVLVVASYMKLPKKEYPDAEKKKKVNRIITAVIVVIIIPAVYLAYSFVQQNNFNQNANKFIAEQFEAKGHVVIYQNVSYTAAGRKIDVAILGTKFSDNDMAVFRATLPQYDLEGVELSVLQDDGFALSEEDWTDVLNRIEGDDDKITALEARVMSERASFMSPTRLLEEAKSFNERITDIALGTLNYASLENELNAPTQIAVIYSSEPLSPDEVRIIENWLPSRIENDAGMFFYYIPEPLVVESNEEEQT